MTEDKREHLLFLTGKLAEKSLTRTLEAMAPTPFTWRVHQLGVSVAALMTAEMIERRLPDAMGADRILVPGRCRGDLEPLRTRLGVPVERGPEELVDLPQFFGKSAAARDLSRYDTLIFAEIVDAPQLSVAAIEARARALAADGADVIDLGCLPQTPFPHLGEAVAHLKRLGFKVSVDSLDDDELLRGGRAGADYLLSLREHTLWIADEVAATPMLIPRDAGRPRLARARHRRASSARAAPISPTPCSTRFISASPTRWRAITRCAEPGRRRRS